MSDRHYEFAVRAAVRVKFRAITGKVIAREADADRLETVEVNNANRERLKAGIDDKFATVAHPVNRYRVEYTDPDTGLATTDWWHGDMLAAA